MLSSSLAPARLLKRLPSKFLITACVAFWLPFVANANMCNDEMKVFRDAETSVIYDRTEIELLFEKMSYFPYPLGVGFEAGIVPRVTLGVAPVMDYRDVYVDLDLAPVARTIEHWTHEGSTYLFANVGFRNLRKMGERINHLVLDHLLNYPTQVLRVFFSARDAEAIDRLVNLRRAIHAQVLRRYSETKGYLGVHDLRALMSHALFSDNCDVLYLVENPRPPIDPRGYTLRDLGAPAALTMQLSYFGDRNFFRPSVRGFVGVAGYSMHEATDQYPFEHRLDLEAARAFREDMDLRFSSEKAGELVRYVKFSKVLPRPVHSMVLLRMMQLAEKRRLETVFAAGDPKTTRLFRGYGFSPYEDLPIESGVNESLTYLAIGGETFKGLYDKLSMDSRNVETKRIDD